MMASRNSKATMRMYVMMAIFTGYRFGDTAQTQFSRSDPEALA